MPLMVCTKWHCFWNYQMICHVKTALHLLRISLMSDRNILVTVKVKVKVKVKVTLEQATKAQRGSRCIALLFLQPRRWMGVGDQRHAPAVLPPGKARYPLYRGLRGPQDRSGRVRKISPPPEFILRTVQPIASRYTDWAIAASFLLQSLLSTFDQG